MTRRPYSLQKTIIFFCILFSCIFGSMQVSAELMSSPAYGYALDLPEGFNLTDKTADGRNYLFSHTILPVQLAISVYDDDIYQSSRETLEKSYTKIGASGDIDAVEWRHTDGSISSFTMQMPGDSQTYKGWAIAVFLQEKKSYLVLLCYAPEEKEFNCEQFILSVLDSLMIDSGSFHEAGIITKYAYPGSTQQQITIDICGKKVKTAIDSEDSEASLFVIQREYAVLTLYAKRNDWKEAWQRYYRMIYKDSCGRLKRPAFDIYNVLYPEAVKKDSKDPDAAVIDKLLEWVQGFEFVRNTNNADFVPLTDAVQGKPCDCDSRSLLLCILAKEYGIDSVLFVSAEYSHAVFGADIDRKGAVINVEGKNYLLSETTTHVAMGLMAQNMTDTSKWIPVELYE